jgi:hypothetical protein
MEKNIEQLIQKDNLELEKRIDLDPFLPARLRSRLQARQRSSKGLSWKVAWASGFCLVIALLTFIHLQWLPGLRSKPAAGRPAVQLNPFPDELQNTIYRSFIEVAQWEK